ncbi:hypothetical protein [Dyadobacter sp. NIV53]|uniref:hypothetical protein n=1 Tax=Dyadobacter sp. NIV53 TaxID=2861765 RepID=UPI001C86C206|nr:hypothetical protein [Dyadobacter sp. NIV53]
MIKRTLITALLILSTYLIAVPLFLPTVQVEQHQLQENKIKAQNFIYNESDTIENVIVGSSLASRILTDSLDHFYNLSFSGLSTFEGLRILLKKEHLPKNIYIETNMILRGEDLEFTSSLFSPYTYYSQAYLPALRTGKEPLALVVETAQEIIKGGSDKKSITEKKTIRDSSQIVLAGNPLFKKVLAGHISNYSNKPDSIRLHKSMEKLKQLVESLKARNVNVVFFEMPVDSSLCGLPLFKVLRETVHQTFPKSKYPYIDQPACGEYITTDGLHLPRLDAIRYTNYFRNKIACHYCS